MIGYLKGTLIDILLPNTVVIDVNGVGYECDVTAQALNYCQTPGQTVALPIHQVIREDGHFLFGFADATEKQAFRSLIKISGVGPKLALTILSHCTIADLAHCVDSDNPYALQAVPGVGKKTAERIAIELRSKAFTQLFSESLTQTSFSTHSAMPSTHATAQAAMDALMALGYKAAVASRMLEGIKKDEALSVEAMVKAALQGAPA